MNIRLVPLLVVSLVCLSIAVPAAEARTRQGAGSSPANLAPALAAPVPICDRYEEFSLAQGFSRRLDLDGDGTPESLVIEVSPSEGGDNDSLVIVTLNAFDPSLGQVVVAGQEMFPASFFGRPTGLVCTWVGDLTGDGKPELVVGVTTQFFARNVEKGMLAFQYNRNQAWTIWKDLLQPVKVTFDGSEIRVEEDWTWQAGLCVKTRLSRYTYDGELFSLAGADEKTEAQRGANCS